MRILRAAVAVLCPLLLAVFPVLSLFAQNQSEVELSLLWPSVAVCVAGAAVLVGVFFLITRNLAKASVLASVLVVAFLYYEMFVDQPARWFLVLWLAAAVVGVVAVLRTRRDLWNVTVILTGAAAAMLVPQALGVVRYQTEHPSIGATDPRLWSAALDKPVVPTGTALPDIFVIIPDDYERADVLDQYFGYDDSELQAQLEARGLVVSDQNRSPYSYSEMNIASLLNMDYLTNFHDLVGPTSEDFNLVKRVEEDSRAARLLTSIGYDYIHLDTDEVTYVGGNPGISPLASPDSFANLWLNKTILGQIGGPLGFNEPAMNERFRDSIRSEFAELGAIPDGPRPRFVVFHTLIPHDPYIFDAQGESVTFPADADHTGRVGMEYYVEQLQYTRQLMLDAVDQILANADTPPVIVIAADEGFEVNEDLFGEEVTQDMRVKGISAFYLPGLDHPGVPDPPNTVNALRFVFNQYLGTDYPMLATVSHLEGDYPFQFEEIPVQ